MSHVRVDNKTNSAEKTRQKKDNGTENLIQPYADDRVETQVQLKQQSLMKQATDNNLKNNTGLPNQLKAGIESLSGMSMDHVKVHYNSDKPAQLNAHAYAQGSDIHVAPGQEQHLPHEAWHVVQQAQGRVKPTMQMKTGAPVNDDVGLEHEADVMGAKALGVKQFIGQQHNSTIKLSASTGTIQRKYPSDDEVEDTSAMRFSSFFGGYISVLGPEVDNEQLILEVASGKQWIYDRVKNRYHSVHLQRRTTVDIEQVAPVKPDKLDHIDLTQVGEKSQSIQQQMQTAKPAYVGGGIVWVGESSIDTLVKRYVEETQNWTAQQRKERLGVVFGINDKEKLDVSANAASESKLGGKVDSVMNSIANTVNAHIFGFKWGVKWKVPGFGEVANDELRTALDEGTMNNTPIEWEMDSQQVETSLAKSKFNEDLKEVSIPYGALRNMVTSSDGLSEVESDLKKNNASTVFFHSVDADAPSFETITPDDNDGYLKVLEAYDTILDGYAQDKDPTMLIGGYNLIEDINQDTNLFDWYHTARSNVVDIAVREAAVAFAPNLVYPTEPNFLIKMDMINKLKQNNKTGAWGVGASEGWELMRQTIEQLKTDNNLTKKTKNDPNTLNPLLREQIAYNPMASVPTGTDAGGVRLKVMSGKKYDENSIKGKPISSNLTQGDTVPISEQYVVQAQSWSGASRLATAYQRAIGTMGASIKVDAVTPLFEPVESMVLQLYAGSKPTFDPTAIRQAIINDPVKTANTKINLEQLIKTIQISLTDLQSSEEWQALSDLQPKG